MATTADDVLSSNIHPALMLGRYDKRKSSPAILGLPFDIANDIATSSTSSTSTSSQLDLHLSRHCNSIEAAMLLANFNRVPTVTKEVQETTPTTTTTTTNNNTTTKGTNSWQDDLNIASQTQTRPSSASLRRHSYDVNMNWKSMPQEFRERADLIENAFASTFSSSSTSAFKPVIKQESLYDTNQIPNRITWTQDGLYQTDTTMNNTPSSSSSSTSTSNNNNNYNIYTLGSNNNNNNNTNNNNNNNNNNNSQQQQQQQQHDYLHPLASSSSNNNSNDLSGQKREFSYYPQQPSYYYHHQPPSSSTNSSTASSPHHLPLTQHMHPSYAPPSPLPLSSTSSSSTSLGKLPLPSSTPNSSSTTMPLPPPPHPYSHNSMYMQGPPHPHPHSHHPHHPPPPPPHSHHPLHHPHHPLSQLPPHNDYYGHPNNPNLMMSQHQPPPPPPQKPKRKRVPKETEEVVEAGDADFPDMCPRDVELAKTDPDARPRRQKLRFDGDMYTPKWVRFNGQAKEGLCDTCQPGRWLQLKNSAYWYHKQFYHGISSVSGAEFVQPIETRWVDQDLVEGLCHQCHQWVAVSNVKRKNSVLWFRHAHKCHVYHKPKNAPLRR
ncbi:unnamed protein product [Cunninghamella echinulata]